MAIQTPKPRSAIARIYAAFSRRRHRAAGLLRKAVVETVEPRIFLSTTATVTLSNLAMTYCGSPMPATATPSVSGLEVDVTYTQAGNVVANPTEAGSYTMAATINDPNYTGSATGTLVIAPAQLTVTATPNSKVYGKTAADMGTISGIWLSDDITATFSSTGDSATASPGNYPITAVVSGSKLADYVVDSNLNNVGTLTVTKVPATVTLSGLAMTYCGSPMPATATPSVSGLTVDVTYTENGNLVANPTEAGSYAMDATIDDPNYQGSATGTLVIAPSPLTITATPNSKTFGKVATETGTISGIWLSDVITATYSSTGDSATASPGNYPISAVVSGPKLALDYVVVSNLNDVGTLSVSKASATVTLANLAQYYCGSPMPATATPSVSGLTVDISFTENGNPVANPTDAGSYAVDAVINDPNYQGSATGTLVISPAHLTVAAKPQSKTYGQVATETGKITGIWLSDVITATYSSAGNPATAGAKTYPITAIVSGPKFALDYVVDTNLGDVGTLTVNRAPLVITANNKTKLLGQPDPVLTATYKGFVNSDGPTSLSSPVVLKVVNETPTVGNFVIAASGAAASNYSITYVNGVLSVTPEIVPKAANFAAQVGHSTTGTAATFTDLAPGATASKFSATINWGDGISSTGIIVSAGAGLFQVHGTHTYAKASTGTGTAITVTIKATDGATAAAHSLAQVTAATLTSAKPLILTVNLGTALTSAVLGSFTDANSLQTNAAVYSASINWGDSSSTSAATFKKTGSKTGVATYWNVLGSHKYAKKGTFTVTFTIHETASTQALQMTATVDVV